MEFAQIIEAWSSVETESDLFSRFKASLGEFGFDQLVYARLRRARQLYDPQPLQVIWPEQWFQYCVSKNTGEFDPIVLHLLASPRATTWDEVESDPSLGREQIDLMSDARAAGMHNGLAVPFHGPWGEVGGISLSKSTKNARDRVTEQTTIMLCHYFHSVYSSLDTSGLDAPSEPLLTAREHEVLLWCAQGKSNWAIGEILGISEHSVKFHVRNIYKKLDANSRIAAVVKAIRMGLIQP